MVDSRVKPILHIILFAIHPTRVQRLQKDGRSVYLRQRGSRASGRPSSDISRASGEVRHSFATRSRITDSKVSGDADSDT